MPLPSWVIMRIIRNKGKWGVPLDLDNILNEALANEWILCQLEKWEEEDIQDKDLWEEYQYKFREQIENNFKKGATNVVKLLKDRLQL